MFHKRHYQPRWEGMFSLSIPFISFKLRALAPLREVFLVTASHAQSRLVAASHGLLGKKRLFIFMSHFQNLIHEHIHPIAFATEAVRQSPNQAQPRLFKPIQDPPRGGSKTSFSAIKYAIKKSQMTDKSQVTMTQIQKSRTQMCSKNTHFRAKRNVHNGNFPTHLSITLCNLGNGGRPRGLCHRAIWYNMLEHRKANERRRKTNLDRRQHRNVPGAFRCGHPRPRARAGSGDD